MGECERYAEASARRWSQRGLSMRCLLPPESAAEAAALGDATSVLAVNNLRDAVEVALGRQQGAPVPALVGDATHIADLAEVRGQLLVRRALEIAAAGGHHMLMTGPPGAGKTMLARCLPGILPRLTGCGSRRNCPHLGGRRCATPRSNAGAVPFSPSLRLPGRLDRRRIGGPGSRRDSSRAQGRPFSGRAGGVPGAPARFAAPADGRGPRHCL